MAPRPETKIAPFAAEKGKTRTSGLLSIAILPFVASGGLGENLAIVGTVLVHALGCLIWVRIGAITTGTQTVESDTPIWANFLKLVAVMPMAHFGFWVTFIALVVNWIQVTLIVWGHQGADYTEAKESKNDG